MHWARTLTAAMATVTTIVGAVALTLTVAGTAHAQETENTNAKGKYRLPDRPLRIRAGAYLPSDSDTKKRLSSNFPSFGLSVDVYRTQWFLPVTYEIYADFYRRIRKTDDFGRFEADSFAVGVGARYDLDPKAVKPQFNPYAGVGVSLSIAKLKQDQFLDSDVVTVPGNYSQTSRRTTLGGKVYLGVEHIRTGFFGEVGYEFAPKPSVFGESVKLSGGHINLGYHF